jgi:RNA:NAD 2'-phosphotransferase (TPT1/KptA family)
MNADSVKISKYLAKYLRHAPHELGLELEPGGWVSVDELSGKKACSKASDITSTYRRTWRRRAGSERVEGNR